MKIIEDVAVLFPAKKIAPNIYFAGLTESNTVEVYSKIANGVKSYIRIKTGFGGSEQTHLAVKVKGSESVPGISHRMFSFKSALGQHIRIFIKKDFIRAVLIHRFARLTNIGAPSDSSSKPNTPQAPVKVEAPASESIAKAVPNQQQFLWYVGVEREGTISVRQGGFSSQEEAIRQITFLENSSNASRSSENEHWIVLKKVVKVSSVRSLVVENFD